MLLRRSSDDAPLAAERVRALLDSSATGWVPGSEDAPAADRSAPHPSPPPAPLAGSQGDADAPAVVRSADEPAEPSPAGPSSPQAPSPLSSAGRPASQVGGALGLPRALTSGRLDPGHRGAVALVVAALLAALVTGLVVLRGRPQEVVAPAVVATGVPLPGTSEASAAPAPVGAGPAEVVVAVAGEVARPGLVRLPGGSRVDDAVRAAGGPLRGSDTGLLNLARVLVDGEQVLVGVDPPPGAPAAAGAPGAPAAGPAVAGGRLDLNAATVQDFDGLPGIGPVLAQRIVDWRTEHGRFASVEQLREVTGIGESKYADLEAKVTV